MEKEELLKLENQMCFDLYVASRLITRTYQPVLDKFQLTYPQYLVLLVLWENNGLTINQIAHRLFLNTNTITPLLKRMENQQLLRRERSTEDERSFHIFLTERAINLKKEAYCVPEAVFGKTEVSVQEMKQLKNTLKLLIHQLDTDE